MRQAGRYLPEYRALKTRYDFLTLARTPELATEVTLQPLKRFALDAAILFSDILIIPEALGQPYHFREQGGIGMDYALDSASRIDGLREVTAVREHLAYVPEALKLVRRELGEGHAVLGFAGSPWTLACYMVEGGSSEHFTRVKALVREDPVRFEALMSKLSDAVAELLLMKIEAGADAVQLFDSWGAACPGACYEGWSLRWIRRVIAKLPPEVPVILFAKGMTAHAPALAATGARVLSLDWTADMPEVRRRLALECQNNGPVALQGNLDPVLMSGSPELVRVAARELLDSMAGEPGHIVNLGHGIHPDARIACVEALVETVGAVG